MTEQGKDLVKFLYVFENYTSGKNKNGISAEDVLGKDFELVDFREQTNYDISLSAYEAEGRLVFDTMYDPNVYTEKEMDRLLERFEIILKAIAENAECRVSEIEMATDEEKQLIFNDFNPSGESYPDKKTLPELFEEQVHKTPDEVAVVYEGLKLTYSELNNRLLQVSNHLLPRHSPMTDQSPDLTQLK